MNQSNPAPRTPPRENLNLHLGETVLPDGNVGGDTVLTVVEEDDHAIGVHGLASEELVVLEVGDDLLGVTGSTLLESGDFLGGGALLLELGLDHLHVAWRCQEKIQIDGSFIWHSPLR
jgi:hypothetical protein